MAFKTFKPRREPVTLTELGTRIARRVEALSRESGIVVEVPRNSGRNRTASKRALLKAIEEIGGKW